MVQPASAMIVPSTASSARIAAMRVEADKDGRHLPCHRRPRQTGAAAGGDDRHPFRGAQANEGRRLRRIARPRHAKRPAVPIARPVARVGLGVGPCEPARRAEKGQRRAAGRITRPAPAAGRGRARGLASRAAALSPPSGGGRRRRAGEPRAAPPGFSPPAHRRRRPRPAAEGRVAQIAGDHRRLP